MQSLELKSYLEEKNIYIVNDKVNQSKYKSSEDILKQVENIICFHNKIGEYKENLLPRIGASIGREIDNYTAQIFLISKYLKEIENKDSLNSIDFYLIKNGELLLNKGKKALNHLYSNNYRKLIERSMKNYEICLSRVDESNLTVSDDNKIFIGTIKYLTYNIKEHDIYSYIKKMKRKDIDISIEKIIDFYVNEENLGVDSREYLRALSSYPNEELRVLEKYIIGKTKLSENEVLESLSKAKSMDFRCLII
ncbi:hypothetical protein ACH36K_18425 [Clostridium sp. MB05]|jgi:hypothetical protein|uniref:hypothetical protein n=1 Tax=Clostridium sp. MB05 TaxID=3376682 RepID=UPI003982BFE4